MAPDDRDAFGNAIDDDDSPSPTPALIPNLGRFAEPLSPTPSLTSPPAEPPPAEPMPAFPPVAPGANAALVIGLFGLFLLLPAPFAWWRGRAVLRQIDASGGRLGGRSQAQTARLLGILGTILLVLAMIGEISTRSGHGG